MIKKLRSDNGGEFVNERVVNLLKSNDIINEPTVVYTPQQNGQEEREFRILLEAVRSMLAETFMKKSFWAEAGNTTYTCKITRERVDKQKARV